MYLHKHKLKFLLRCLIITTILYGYPIDGVKAEHTESSSLDSMYKWLLDEVNGYIYYATKTNKLLFIDKNGLQTFDQFTFQEPISDLYRLNDTLYISLSDKIIAIDIKEGTIQNTYKLLNFKSYEKIKNIVATKEKIYYVLDSNSSVFEFDLSTRTQDELLIDGKTKWYHEADLAFDNENHMLYVGESGVTGSDIFAINIKNRQTVSKSTYDDNYGFYYPENKVIFNDNKVFYAGRSFEADNLSIIHGDFNSTVLQVYNNYVLTRNNIYDRENYAGVPYGIKGSNYLMDGQQNLFVYSSDDQKIRRVILSVDPNKPTEFLRSENQLKLSAPLTDWVHDEKNGMIYAVSEQKNTLYYIRTNDLSVTHEIPIGSNPVDIEMHGDKLYVALWGATKVAIVNKNFNGNVNSILLDETPYRIEVNGDKMFYTEQDQFQDINYYEFDTGFKKELTIVGKPRFPEMLLDEENGRLFIAETLEGDDVYAVDTKELNIIDQSSAGSSRESRLILEDGNLFITKLKLDANTLSTVYGGFNLELHERILDAFNHIAISDRAIYDSETFKKLSDLPYKMSLVDIHEDGEVWLYSKESGTIYKDPENQYLPLNISQFTEELEPPKKLLNYFPIDIDNHWASKQLHNFVDTDVLKGYLNSNGLIEIKPNQQITRAEFVALLVRSLGLESNESTEPFKDVDEQDWYYEPVRIASSLDIVKGVDETHFAPEQNIRRDEIATLVVRAFESTVSFNGEPKSFKDVPSYWATHYIEKASAAGIVNGVTADKFHPFANAERGEGVVMLYRALHLQSSDMPDNNDLESLVLNFENHMSEAFANNDYDQIRELTNYYTTGHYQAWSHWNTTHFEKIAENGVTIQTIFNGNLSAEVIDKSNLFASVELNGAEYEITYQKGGRKLTNSQDTSGIIYLKKSLFDGEWKIYDQYLPNL